MEKEFTVSDTKSIGIASNWPGIITAYRNRLPETKDWKIISLHEGNTPLISAPYLSKLTGTNVFLKFEGLNPTGSFKDRGMTMAVSQAVSENKTAILCASTGNTSASAAAYAARANLTCVVLIPVGKIALGKLAQALVHGAKIVQIEGNFDDCLELAQKTVQDFPEFTLVNSVNPVRILGQKTAAFEVIDALGTVPDIHFLPVGNAGNITAYWKGYKEYYQANLIDSLPKMIGVQAAGAAPLVLGEAIKYPETIATAIRIGNPASWQAAVKVKAESEGKFLSVTDEKILIAYHSLAKEVGVFVEPASAASVAGLLQEHAAGNLPTGINIVCTVTGNGLKDPDTALTNAGDIKSIPKSAAALVDILGL